MRPTHLLTALSLLFAFARPAHAGEVGVAADSKGGFHPTFVNISFVGANALAKELGADGEGVIVSQVVPFPWDTSLKVVADDQAAQRALDPTLTPDFVSLEGYLSGRLAAAALEIAGPDPTRANMLD